MGVYGFGKCLLYDWLTCYAADAERVYGVGGVLKAVQSFYVDSRVCVRGGVDVNREFSHWCSFEGCVMSLSLFSVYVSVCFGGKGV